MCKAAMAQLVNQEILDLRVQLARLVTAEAMDLRGVRETPERRGDRDPLASPEDRVTPALLEQLVGRVCWALLGSLDQLVTEVQSARMEVQVIQVPQARLASEELLEHLESLEKLALGVRMGDRVTEDQ